MKYLKLEAHKLFITKEQHQKNTCDAAKKRRRNKRRYWLKKLNDKQLIQKLFDKTS